jgi:hypothetical protein
MVAGSHDRRRGPDMTKIEAIIKPHALGVVLSR